MLSGAVGSDSSDPGKKFGPGGIARPFRTNDNGHPCRPGDPGGFAGTICRAPNISTAWMAANANPARCWKGKPSPKRPWALPSQGSFDVRWIPGHPPAGSFDATDSAIS